MIAPIFDDRGRNNHWEETGRIIQKIGVRAARKTKNDLRLVEGPEKYPQLGRVFADYWKSELQITEPTDLYDDNTKWSLTERILQALSERQGGVNTGYAVTGRIIGYCVITAQRLQPSGTYFTPEVFRDQIVHKETMERGLLPLARMANDFNRQYEEALGFNEDGYALATRDGYTPLQIAEARDGSFYYKLNLVHIMQTVGSITAGAMSRYTAEHPTETCPAQRFLPFLVRQMADICVENPHYFAADLGVPAPVEVQ